MAQDKTEREKAREARLKAALRDNLRKRKAQDREQGESEAGAPETHAPETSADKGED